MVRYVSCGITNMLSRRVREYHRSHTHLNKTLLKKKFKKNVFTSSVSRAVLTELWDRSTIIPSRFISLMTVCKETRFELGLEPGLLERRVRQFILCRGRKSCGCGEKITKKWNKTRRARDQVSFCSASFKLLQHSKLFVHKRIVLRQLEIS